ncbi:MAG: macro domain-containing protein, partial [Pseudomonadota bacterium]
DVQLEIIQGDVTEMEVDGVVNAANAQLILGSGVAGAIRRKGGPTIQAECDQIGGTFVGGAVVTGGGDLRAKYVVHAVGPRLGEGDEDRKLADAVRNSLSRAVEYHMASIAFPAVSTGIFGFPLDRAARIMLRTAADSLAQPTSLKKVYFCLFGQEAYDVFAAEFKKLFPRKKTVECNKRTS